MTSRTDFDLAPEIAALCDDAKLWLDLAAVVAWSMGVTLPEGIAAMLRNQQRIYTGYMPEPQRRNVLHRMYCDGLLVRPLRRAA